MVPVLYLLDAGFASHGGQRVVDLQYLNAVGRGPVNTEIELHVAGNSKNFVSILCSLVSRSVFKRLCSNGVQSALFTRCICCCLWVATTGLCTFVVQ